MQPTRQKVNCGLRGLVCLCAGVGVQNAGESREGQLSGEQPGIVDKARYAQKTHLFQSAADVLHKIPNLPEPHFLHL